MPAIAKHVGRISSAIALLVLLFLGTFAILDYGDRCDQHSNAESRAITEKVNNLLLEKGAFSVQEIVNSSPIFYCLAAHRADFSGLTAFAKKLNYTIPTLQLYCGFWSYKGRLLMFFQNSVLDAEVPLYLRDFPDESAMVCFEDLGTKHTKLF